METLHEALVEQLKDLYSAETQLVEALPEMAKGATAPSLKNGLKTHLQETKEQVKRLDSIAKLLDEDLSGHTCKAMKGIIKEAQDTLEEEYEYTVLKDIMIVAASQRVEHYEIAGYGNAVALAKELGLEEVVDLLNQTLEQEKETDAKLSALCEKELFKTASREIEAPEARA